MSHDSHELPLRGRREQKPAPPGPMDVCAHCGRRCRVPVTRLMPDRVRRAYEAAGWEFMATCEAGAAAEARRFGASYEDVVADRIHRVEESTGAEHSREQGASSR
jgi:hypothetical protein